MKIKPRAKPPSTLDPAERRFLEPLQQGPKPVPYEKRELAHRLESVGVIRVEFMELELEGEFMEVAILEPLGQKWLRCDRGLLHFFFYLLH